MSEPPLAKPIPVTAQRHGETVVDDYAWLRDKADPGTLAYLQAENAYTAAQTAEWKGLEDELYAEMLARIQQTDLSVPARSGRYLYYSRTVEGLQYPIHCRRAATREGETDDAPEAVLLDLNQLAAGLEFFSLGAFEVSDDGRRLAYTADTTGMRQYQLHIKDLDTGALLPDTAERVTSLVWAADHATLLFTTEDAVTKRSNLLFRHRLGGASELVYEERDELFHIGVERTQDKRYILLDIFATNSAEVRYLPSATPEREPQVFRPREKDHKYSVGHREGVFYIRTDLGAKNYRVVTAPAEAPDQWTEFIPHDPQVLIEDLTLFRDFAVAAEKAEALNRFRIYDFAAGRWTAMAFPEPVYAAYPGANPEYDTPLFRYGYQSFTTPPSVFDYDMRAGLSALLKQQPVLGGYDPSRYRAERVWVTARDGARVPLSIACRADVKRDGQAPLLLYGYGAYGLGMSASFSIARLSLLDRGMVYAIAHIRGGNELGEAWHDDGMLMKKANTFNDFIDCAEHLVAQRWTAPRRLAIEGGSAGGLLIGAVLNMRPELFAAAHLAVPFVDVMNTMSDATLPLTVGEYLEWGDPADPAAYACMRAYSPYDNLAPRPYPAMLVTTSLNDSQVMYWEPAKYVAKLRSLHPPNQLLLKTNLGAGHGGASGRYDKLRETAFEYAWLLSHVR